MSAPVDSEEFAAETGASTGKERQISSDASRRFSRTIPADNWLMTSIKSPGKIAQSITDVTDITSSLNNRKSVEKCPKNSCSPDLHPNATPCTRNPEKQRQTLPHVSPGDGHRSLQITRTKGRSRSSGRLGAQQGALARGRHR